MYVLIIMYAGYGVATAEFNSRHACEYGLKEAKSLSSFISGRCTPKGRK